MAPPRRLYVTLMAVEGSGATEPNGGFCVRPSRPLLTAPRIQRLAIGAARHQAIFQFPRRVELMGQEPAEHEQENYDAQRDHGAPLTAIRAVTIHHAI